MTITNSCASERSQDCSDLAVLAPAREPAAGGASDANRRGASWASCELRDASCASESAVPHGAKERSAGGSMWWPRARSPRWLSPPQSSRSCTVRGMCVFARGGGGVPVVASLRSTPLHQRLLRRRPLSLGMPAARASLLPASVTCVSRAYSALRTTFIRRIRGLRRVFAVSAASLSCLVLVVRVSLLRRSLCLLAPRGNHRC